MHLISLKSHFIACLECQVTVLSKLNFKKTCMQKVLIFEKKSVHHLDSNPRPECKSVSLPIEPYGCGFRWNFALLLHLQPERNLITTLTHGDKLEVWVYDVRQSICRCWQLQAS